MGRITLLGAGKPPAAAAGGGGWTSPLDASTPAVFWIDASNAASVTVSNPGGNPENVTAWNDLGTGAHHLTTTTPSPNRGLGLVNGRAAIVMVGGATMKTAAFTLAQPFMLVAVWKQDEAPGFYGQIFLGDRDRVEATAAILFTKFNGFSDHFAMHAGSQIDQGVSVVVGTNYHYRGVFNGASSSSKLNASSLTGINPGTNGIFNGIILGVENQGAGAAYCEMFIIPNSTAADATNAEAYIAAKWFSADTTAPVLSSPTGTKTGSTTATLSVSTDEGNGTLYGAASAAVPTKAQIKAGQNSTGAASSYAFNQAVSSTGVQNKNATGLTASTSYTMHYMQEDTTGNQSNIASAAAFTTDAAAGGLSDIIWVSSYSKAGVPAPGLEQAGLAFGPATADRVLVVFTSVVGAADSDNFLWGVKINDVTATQATRGRVGQRGMGIHFLNVPAGTTGKVEVDAYTNGWMNEYAVIIGYMTGSATASVASVTSSASHYPNGNTPTAVTVPANCVAALVAFVNEASGFTTTWTNATRLDDEGSGGVTAGGSAAFLKTSATVTLAVAPASSPWGWGGVIFQP